jgi:hypothetical protein
MRIVRIIIFLLCIAAVNARGQVSVPGKISTGAEGVQIPFKLSTGTHGTAFAGYAPQAASLLNSLKAWWKLSDERDAYGNNDLTNSNGVTFTTGKLGNASSHIRSSMQSLTISDNAEIGTGDYDWTFAGWIYFDNKANAKTLIGKRDNSTSGTQEWALVYDSSIDRLVFNIWNSGTTINQCFANNFGSPSTGTWYFVRFWHDNTNNQIGIRVNEGTANTQTLTVTPWDGTAVLKCGCQIVPSTTCHDGRLDEWAKWNRLLTDSEGAYLYNSGTGRTFTGGLIQ